MGAKREPVSVPARVAIQLPDEVQQAASGPPGSMDRKNGHPPNLVASHPNNAHPAKHGIYLARLREPRAGDCRFDHGMGHGRATVGDRCRHALKGQLVQDAQRLDGYLHGRTGEVVALTERRVA